MRKIRHAIAALLMLLCCSANTASAQVSIGIGIGFPNVSIGINLPLYPELVAVPGYPVYYATQLSANYFFYDGMYWVFHDDNWYASTWYNGPWGYVQPTAVPLYILRVPVRYYRQPPVYFRGWQPSAPPRWGQHWGPEWEQHRRGWDKWKRGSAPPRAPLPAYQRQYTGDRYPHRVEQQQQLRSQSYRYQPRDKAVRQHYQQQRAQRAPAPNRQEEHRMRSPGQQEIQHQAPAQQGGRPQPLYQPPPQQRGPAYQEQRQQPAAAPHERQAPQQPHGQDQRYQERQRGQEHQGQGHGQGQRRDEDRGR